ncbi:MAG: hypothetical protein KIS66_10045 [Fimbriimonadaceae bacterium]|nr:hypothetical protein [Fimbriimonadaceae bacterium]
MTAIRLLPVLGWVAAVVVLVGCDPSEPVEPAPSGKLIEADQGFDPAALPYTNAELVIEGIPLPVEVSRETDGDNVVFNLVAHGQVLDSETYAVRSDPEGRPEAFSFVSTNDLRFDPPIELLRFPMRVGAKVPEWKGQVREGDQPYNAWAALQTKEETTNLPAPYSETLRVDVELVMETRPEATKRELTFWFVAGKGIVKRQLGPIYARQPAEPR